jgi:lantibiotic modifying enzyme
LPTPVGTCSVVTVVEPSAIDATGCARGAFDWIGLVAVDVDGALGWLEGGKLFDDLYSGTAGVLLGCAEAAASGLDTAAVAAGALARLLHLAARGTDVATMPDDGLFSGWAGVSVALRAWSGVAGDADAGAGSALVTSRIAERVLRASGDRARCTDVISGDAGTLLALLADDSDAAIAAANLLADKLVRAAEPDPDGLQWRMTADYPRLMPGFSHGTAGVAYALAAAGRRLDRRDLVAAAARGAETLLALGHTPDGWALPLVIPPQPHRAPVSFGWCHGPVGTVRLFLMLDAIDPQPRWQHAIDACLRALADSGLPARLYPGFWDNLARCCGTAGVGQLLLDRYQATGDTGLLDWADLLAADVIDRAVVTPGGVTWSNTEHTRTPPELPPEPGLMQGAAGIGGWLARLHALHLDRHTPPAPTGLEPSWL